MHYYIESLRTHVKRAHCPDGDVDTYIDGHGPFETRDGRFISPVCLSH